MAYTGVGTDPGASPTLLVYADVVGGNNIQGVKPGADATAGSSTPVGTSGNPLWTQTSASANSLNYHTVATGSNNAANIKASSAQLFAVHVFNNAAYPVYVKCYNKAQAPLPGTDVPIATVGVQAGTGLSHDLAIVELRVRAGDCHRERGSRMRTIPPYS